MLERETANSLPSLSLPPLNLSFLIAKPFVSPDRNPPQTLTLALTLTLSPPTISPSPDLGCPRSSIPLPAWKRIRSPPLGFRPLIPLFLRRRSLLLPRTPRSGSAPRRGRHRRRRRRHRRRRRRAGSCGSRWSCGPGRPPSSRGRSSSRRPGVGAAPRSPGEPTRCSLRNPALLDR